ARVSAILDVRQVFGGDRSSQEILCHILMDHDIVRRDGEDPIVPAFDSPLWERLPDVPRRNAKSRLAGFYASGVTGSDCPVEAISQDFGQVCAGRHRFPVMRTDLAALQRRWCGGEDLLFKADCTAHIVALYRALENPLAPVDQRSALQLVCNPRPTQGGAVQYELFASPFNARVENGRFASRWPHVEAHFGSAGSYPAVLDIFPEDAVVGVNPPFSDAYLEHVVGQSLERIVSRFRKVHLWVPIREAPWRSQLHRLRGATFVNRFWDATALKERPIGQQVLYWEGSELANA
ncbi:unnamed protein product, partial [Prorocentrum cordatum]